jgi:hypothetical protein
MTSRSINGAIGFGGTLLAFMSLQNLNYAAGIIAGLATSAWMLRQLWLSRKGAIPPNETGK